MLGPFGCTVRSYPKVGTRRKQLPLAVIMTARRIDERLATVGQICSRGW